MDAVTGGETRRRHHRDKPCHQRSHLPPLLLGAHSSFLKIDKLPPTPAPPPPSVINMALEVSKHMDFSRNSPHFSPDAAMRILKNDKSVRLFSCWSLSCQLPNPGGKGHFSPTRTTACEYPERRPRAGPVQSSCPACRCGLCTCGLPPPYPCTGFSPKAKPPPRIMCPPSQHFKAHR